MTRTGRVLGVVGAAIVMMAGIGMVGTAGAADDTAGATAVVPVAPYRILDTRNGIGTGGSTSPVGPGQTIDVQIAGVGPVPAGASGVVLNLTGTQTTEPTYITAWPAGGVMPTASVLNLTPGIDAPNGVTALLGAGGKLSLFNFTGQTHLVADVAGYLVPAGGGAGVPGPPGPPGPAGPTAASFTTQRLTGSVLTASPATIAQLTNGGAGAISPSFPARLVINGALTIGDSSGTASNYARTDCELQVSLAGAPFAVAGPTMRTETNGNSNHDETTSLALVGVVDANPGTHDVRVVCLNAGSSANTAYVRTVSLSVIAVAR